MNAMQCHKSIQKFQISMLMPSFLLWMKVVCKSKDTITLLIQQILVDFQNQGKSAGPWIWSWTYVYLLYCNIAQLFIFWKLLLEALLSILDNFNFYNYWKMYINEIMTVCSLNLNTQNLCLFVNHNSRTYPGRRCPRYCLLQDFIGQKYWKAKLFAH